jgi:hypothetical protein
MITTKIVLISQQRQGSTLAHSLIKRRSNTHGDAEIFCTDFLNKNYPKWATPIIKKYPKAYVKLRELQCKQSVYVFKFMVNHLERPRSFVHHLARRGYKVVSIYRKDAIGIALSRCIAEQTNIWYIQSLDRRTSEKLTIPLPNFFNALKEVELYYRVQEKVLNGLDYLSINDNFENYSKAISNFTGLPYELLTSLSLPTDDRLDSERIENFNEIMDAIKASPYAHYLDNYIGDKH